MVCFERVIEFVRGGDVGCRFWRSVKQKVVGDRPWKFAPHSGTLSVRLA